MNRVKGWWTRSGLIAGVETAIKLMDQNEANIFTFHVPKHDATVVVVRGKRVVELQKWLEERAS